MTIVELTLDGKEDNWIRFLNDSTYMGRIWGKAEGGWDSCLKQWSIVIYYNDGIVAFIYADAIRRK